MKTITPNMAAPMRNPKAFATLKMEILNSRIGMIGSLARSSTSTNSAASARPPTRSASPSGLPQPSSGPAHAV